MVSLGAPLRRGREPQSHRTVDRVTRIVEEVVYNPGLSLADLARALDAPKSSVHGFVSGLLAKGWLYADERRFYLGPALHGLTLASGHIRAGAVTQADLVAVYEETGTPVFLGVSAGDDLIYIAEAGGDSLSELEARTNIRRTLLGTASGKALLAARSDADLKAFLRRRRPDEAELVNAFLREYEEIRRTGIATNIRASGTRFAIGTAIRNKSGAAVAAIALVGRAAEVEPRAKQLEEVLTRHATTWSQRSMARRQTV